MRPSQLPVFQPLTATVHSEAKEQQRFFTELAVQVGQWSHYNFGLQAPHRPAMGMVEELNELEMALRQLNSPEVLDAVGDVTIYMANYFSLRGWDLGEAWAQRSVVLLTDPIGMATQLSRYLCHYQLKGEQDIRGGSEKHDISMRLTCSQTLWFLLSMSNFLGVDYIELVAKVWGRVKLRDWVKNKDAAHRDPSQQLPQRLPNYEVGDEVHD